MKIAFVSGSHRQDSQSLKVAKFLENRAKKLFSAETYVLDLGNNPLPLWDVGMWKADPKWAEAWGPHSAELKTADAVVIISPEWGGMVPSGLKNFFLLCGGQELSHKPGLLVGVSGSRGGAYPIAELRMSSYKNTQICYTPEHLIIREVESVLNDADAPASADDKYLQGRCDHALKILVEYAKALSAVRGSGVVDYKAYPFGM